MLAVFHKSLSHPPPELRSPNTGSGPKSPEDILRAFHASHPSNAFSATFSGGAAIAAVSSGGGVGGRQRHFCSADGIYCAFVGSVTNLSALMREYGLCWRSTDEAVMVAEAYRTLRDRGPYPADQVLKDLEGSFAFVLYDYNSATIFAAMSSDGGIPLYWGIAADGSVVIADQVDVVKGGCGKSFAPFPAGCMFHSEGGLRSFEHPMNKMKAVPRVDSEGVMCGASFKVDTYSRINSMPRAGSAADWTSWNDSC